MPLQIITTADGSHSIYFTELDEHYHSIHGAINESLHVFINAGLNYINKESINILEIGFGTGLNVLLTYLESMKNKTTIHYTSIEAFPIQQHEIIEQLNYTDLIETDSKQVFSDMHTCDWNTHHQLSSNFILEKRHSTIQTFKAEREYDIIYFDAFGPRVQPEMWTTEIFEKMFNCLNNNGILVTYCAKGEVKRNLKKVGFKVETLPGPPRKREMTRAIKE